MERGLTLAMVPGGQSPWHARHGSRKGKLGGQSRCLVCHIMSNVGSRERTGSGGEAINPLIPVMYLLQQGSTS